MNIRIVQNFYLPLSWFGKEGMKFRDHRGSVVAFRGQYEDDTTRPLTLQIKHLRIPESLRGEVSTEEFLKLFLARIFVSYISII